MFYNFTNKPFTTSWDSHAYTFQPGEVAEANKMRVSDDGQHSVLMTLNSEGKGVCDIFAHALAVTVLNHPDLQVNFTYNDKGEAIPQEMKQMLVYNNASIDALKARAKSAPEVPVEYPASLQRFLDSVEPEEVKDEAVAAPVVEAVEEPKKRSPGRPKKEEASPSENVEFAV